MLYCLETKGSFQILKDTSWNSINPDVIHSSGFNANNWLLVSRYDNFDPEAAPLYDVPDFGQTNLKAGYGLSLN